MFQDAADDATGEVKGFSLRWEGRGWDSEAMMGTIMAGQGWVGSVVDGKGDDANLDARMYLECVVPLVLSGRLLLPIAGPLGTTVQRKHLDELEGCADKA